MTTSTSPHASTPHLADGELLALLDGERHTALVLPRQHVSSCDVCRTRMEALRAYDTAAHDSLKAIPIPVLSKEDFLKRVAARSRVKSPLWLRPAWRAAAAVVVLAGAAAAASPVRQWIRDRLQPSHVEAPRAVAPSVAPPAQATPSSGTTVAFAPTGPSFTIRFDSVPRAGALNAERVSESQIAVHAVSDSTAAASDALVVLPNEVRVRNTSTSSASYSVSVPPTVTHVHIVVADREVYDGPAPATVSLTRRP